MQDLPSVGEDRGAVRKQIREHLQKALQLLDSLDRASICAARLQHVIDEIAAHG